jgi:hypothetical protein
MMADLNSWLIRIQVFAVFIQLLGYAKLFLLPIFLWSVARCLKARGLEDNCITLAKICVGTVALGFLFQLLFRVVHLQFLLFILAPLGLISGLLHLAQTILTLLILINIRRAIEDKIND